MFYKLYSIFSALIMAISKIFNDLNLSIVWNLPHGLTVKHGYLVKESISLEVFSYSNSKLNLTKTHPNKFDKKKQKRAFMPNLIHSLDAASMTLTFKTFQKSTHSDVNIFTIHDCFATTANNVPYLLSSLIAVFISLYKDA